MLFNEYRGEHVDNADLKWGLDNNVVLKWGRDNNLPFVQHVTRWRLSNTKPKQADLWYFDTPYASACYGVQVFGKLKSVELGVMGDKWTIWERKALDNTSPQRVALNTCFSPLRLGLLTARLQVAAEECPQVQSVTVFYLDPCLYRAEAHQPVIQGYSHVPAYWDCENQRLLTSEFYNTLSAC